ncbi:MAG: hypothetical protein HOP12_09715 [Candidatus Eisenbacteria bacterium]|uniref:Uncharacterized protein n=1 Tax=Eiseniibacteriota bacterium TaxID=2212470 RepID=A0A849SL30_UNCEI|nr:hypothetical protein [Candidatus Eisenbacteria bacterium]
MALLQLCAVLSEFDHQPVAIVSRPDREGAAGGCDALIQRGLTRVAIEHTTVHSIGDRPGLPKRWERIAPHLRARIQAELPLEWIQIWLPLFELPRSRHWQAMIGRIAEAVIADVPGMALDSELKVQVPAHGFYVLVRRVKPFTPQGICTISWRVPGLPYDYVVKDMRRAIADKRQVLEAYRREVEETILLLDSDECGLPSEFMQAFLDAVVEEPVEAFDEVYLACTMAVPILLYPFKWGETLMPEPEARRGFLEAQDRANATHIGRARRDSRLYARLLRSAEKRRRAQERRPK